MERCSLCPGVNNCVPTEVGTGDITFIGEAPDYYDNKSQHPFSGKTGKELREHYLPLAGVRPGSATITYAVKCLPNYPHGKLDSSKPEHLALLESCCMAHLWDEQSYFNSKVLVPMGTFACLALDPNIRLDLHHGMPYPTAWGTAFPMYSPASGMHEPKRMLLIRNDWARLGKYLKGKLVIPTDRFPITDYKLTTPEELLDDYLSDKCNHYTLPLACDTEITRFGEPYCLTFSTCTGTGRMILADDADSLDIFQQIVTRWQGPILWHNWMFDAKVTAKMGLTFPANKIVDTMVMAYHLGNLPQGLKALAFRLLGMTMMDFDDLVTPYSIPLCLTYLRNAYGEEWPKPDPESVRDDKTGQWKLYKPQSAGARLKRVLSDYGKNPIIDIFERWNKWAKEGKHQVIVDKMGPWPGKDIRYASFEKQLFYACRDADALIRLYPELLRMKHNVRRLPQEQWT